MTGKTGRPVEGRRKREGISTEALGVLEIWVLSMAGVAQCLDHLTVDWRAAAGAACCAGVGGMSTVIICCFGAFNHLWNSTCTFKNWKVVDLHTEMNCQA
ncbi:hypothetical protein B0J18DRAFT_117972 [Chaetomium sp. MPI-SDFR-AT-0129]|nr:hypothetical protein B0J18DRAFT_117972 [Chaetomium sp. MPI-SDFR-AT-0129]